MKSVDFVQGLRSVLAPSCSSSVRPVAGRPGSTCPCSTPRTVGLGLNVPDVEKHRNRTRDGPRGILTNRFGKDRLLSGAPKSHRHHNPFDFYPDDKPPNIEEAVFGTDEFMHQQYV